MRISEEIEKLNLPKILEFADGAPVTAGSWPRRREEIVRIFADNEFGHSPKGPFTVTGERYACLENEYANKVLTERYMITVKDEAEGVEFKFPILLHTPKLKTKMPIFIFMNIRPDSPDKYMPVEEITDRGAAVARIYYNDIAKDEEDHYSSGVAPLYPREKYDWAKIGMWAWAMSRTLDFVLTLDRYDEEKVASLGHSRLGKTSLWCGAQDERVKYVCTNDAGCSGDAITRNKDGEHILSITEAFPFWFNAKYKEYANNEDSMPFDQHMLVASIAPRRVCGGSAVEDTWADPNAQYMSYFLANEARRTLGMEATAMPDRRPKPGDVFADGPVGFHLRGGSHFLSREDWDRYLSFLGL